MATQQKMKKPSLLIAALLVAACHKMTPVTACLSYQGRAELEGLLIDETFAGPPEYESIERGDRPETYWLLRLMRPTCVDADPRDKEHLNPRVERVENIQLVLTSEQYAKYRNLMGQRIRISGTLFGAISAHHHTPALLERVVFE